MRIRSYNMTEREQFIAFVESLRTEDNAHTISAIVEGYEACMEAGLLKKIGKAAMPYAAAAGMLGAGVATGALDDSELVKYQQEEDARTKYSTPELSELIKVHESAIKSGDKQARAKAYDALKKANVAIGFDQNSNFKFYWDKNMGRAFYPDGQEVPLDERQDLPNL